MRHSTLCRRALLVATTVAAGLALHACGGGGDSGGYQPPTGGNQPNETPVKQVVTQMTGASLQAEWAGVAPFTTSHAGTIEATVDWTYSTNDVDLALADGSCTVAQLQADQCRFVAFAVSETAKPEKLQLASAAAGAYTLVVSNLGPGDESVSFQVVLSYTGVAASGRVAPVTVRWRRPLRGAVELRY